MELQGRKVLVTGGAGFVGSHLVDSLLKLGCRVIAYDNFDDFYSDKEKNIEHNLGDENFQLVRGSILDKEELSSAMRGVDIVFHEAAQAGVRYCINNPMKAEEVNVVGTLNVLLTAREKKVKKMVYASSSSVYGKPAKSVLSEEHPLRPTSPYGVSKLAAERYCLAFHETYGVPVTCLRYFSVYGPRGRPDQVVYSFAQSLAEDRAPIIYGDGRQSRDFTFVSDIVSGTILAAMADESVGEVFNVGYGKEFSIEGIARKVIEYFGKDIEPHFVDGYRGDFPRTLCRNTKARTLLRWTPQINLEKGLNEFLDWFTSTKVGNLAH